MPRAAGDFEGGIRLWDLAAGCCAAAVSYGGPQWERAVSKLAWLPGACNARGAPLLLAAGHDGCIKVWALELGTACSEGPGAAGASEQAADGSSSSSGGVAAAAAATRPCALSPVNEFRAAARPRDCVTAMAVAASPAGSDGGPAPPLRLVTGDSAGHVRVWAASGLDISSPAAAAASLRPLAAWRAARAGVVSAAFLPRHGLLLLASDDSSVSLWGLQVRGRAGGSGSVRCPWQRGLRLLSALVAAPGQAGRRSWVD